MACGKIQISASMNKVVLGQSHVHSSTCRPFFNLLWACNSRAEGSQVHLTHRAKRTYCLALERTPRSPRGQWGGTTDVKTEMTVMRVWPTRPCRPPAQELPTGEGIMSELRRALSRESAQAAGAGEAPEGT